MFKRFRQPKLDRTKSAALYNEIGSAAVEDVGQLEAKILIYAELNEDDEIDYFVRFAKNSSAEVESLCVGVRLATAIWELVSYLKGLGDKHVWRSMEYVVDCGNVDIALSYKMPASEMRLELADKSPKLVEKHFGARRRK